MALTGHLSDLSLSELIEFFCNQRKTGRLKVLYPQGPGSFYLQTGSVVDARIGVLRGIDAVYYALTLPNAKFEFSGSDEASERTINQPWTQVVLEGLRRLDEGIEPANAFPETYVSEEAPSADSSESESQASDDPNAPAFMSFFQNQSTSNRKPFILGAIAIAILGSVAAVGVPAGWYKRSKPVAAASAPAAAVENQPVAATPDASTSTENSESESQSNDAAALAAKRQRDRERLRAREEARGSAESIKNPNASAAQDVAKGGPKKVTVTVTYDESGRVVQASGGDSNAIRIARQKRFPAGKAGSATVTIPIK